MVTPLSSSTSALHEAAESAELPLSQVLTSRSPRNDQAAINGYGPSLRSITSASPPTQDQRISFRSFQISDLALFFLRAGKLPYVAFNEGAPHYYLANESIQAAILGGEDKNPPAYICGEIIFIDTFQATEVSLIAKFYLGESLNLGLCRISIHIACRTARASML